MPVEVEVLMKQTILKRKCRHEKLVRDIQSERVNGKVLPNGATCVYKPKGIQNWYTTAELKKLVTERFDSWEESCGVRKCPINGAHQLQIRGKHLRRLLKAMPDVKQQGRWLIEIKS